MFANGVINCNGKVASFEEGRMRLSRYVRQLKKYGCPVCLRDVKIITVSVSGTLSGELDLYRLARDRTILYELFPAENFKMEGINFCCFYTGKVVITGIRLPSQMTWSI